jgi:hypothetical protein
MLRLVKLPEFCHFATILSVRFRFRALFSVKSDWILGCTARDLRSEGTKAVRRCRDCDETSMLRLKRSLNTVRSTVRLMRTQVEDLAEITSQLRGCGPKLALWTGRAIAT